MLTNHIKHKCDYSALPNYSFLDSMLLLKQKGDLKVGLASLIDKKARHSALKNSKSLHKFYNKTDVCIMIEDSFTCHKIEQYLSVKLPIEI